MNVDSNSDSHSDNSKDVVNLVREKILHTLEVFPFISASMLNIGIGTSTPSILWRPVLEGLVREGLVKETSFTAKNPKADRQQSYTLYHLASNDYSTFQPNSNSNGNNQ